MIGTLGITEERLDWIDSIKGIAMSMVILGHVTQKYYLWDIYPAYTTLIQRIFDFIYSFHMPLFMMISGFLFYRSYVAGGGVKKEKLKIHFLNLLILYIVFALFEGCIKILFSQDVVTEVHFRDLFLIMVMPLGGRLWYLYVLLEYYIIFSRNIVLKAFGKWWMTVACLALSMLNVLTDYSCFFAIRHLLRNLFPFYLGMLIYKNHYGDEKKKMSIANKITLIILSVLVIILRVKLWFLGEFDNDLPVLSLLFGVTVSTLIFILFMQIRGLSKITVLKSIGLISLELFIFQEYPLTVFAKLAKRFLVLPWYISILLCFVITVFSVELFTMFLKMVHIHRIIFHPCSFAKTAVQKNGKTCRNAEAIGKDR